MVPVPGVNPVSPHSIFHEAAGVGLLFSVQPRLAVVVPILVTVRFDGARQGGASSTRTSSTQTP